MDEARSETVIIVMWLRNSVAARQSVRLACSALESLFGTPVAHSSPSSGQPERLIRLVGCQCRPSQLGDVVLADLGATLCRLAAAPDFHDVGLIINDTLYQQFTSQPEANSA